MKKRRFSICDTPYPKLSSFIFFLLIYGFSQNLYAQTWQEKNEDENYTARHQFGFTQVGDKFIMFGGRESPTVLDVYDYNTNTWSNGGAAPVEFNHFQAVTYEGLIWVMGAFKTNEPTPEQSTDYIYMYNPSSEEWIQGIEIPNDRKRGAAGVAMYNNKFYIVGGNVNGHNGGYVAYFDEFDPATGTYTQLTDAPNPRDHFQVVVYNDKLYALSGRLSGGPDGLFKPQVPEVDVYDFTSSTWTTLPAASNITHPRAGAAVVLFQDEIFVIGGETTFGSTTGNNGQRDIVEAFDPVTETWTTKASLNYRRHGIQAIVSGDGIHIAGGSEGGNSMKKMEYYNIDNPTGSPNINSIFTPDETTKLFLYGENQGTANIQITMSNTTGTTGTYIDNVTISGANYTLDANYDNRLVGANQNMIIEVTLNDTTQETSSGVVVVTYNNNYTHTIYLEGTLDPSLTIEDNESFTDLMVFPNPTNSHFSLNKAATELTLFDISGKLIKKFEGEFKANHRFDISNISQSIYFLKVRNKNHKTQTLKISKF
ncbi:T9SS type A sorting domain-containing protein [Oceanihabitans sediminis]|uniref:Kelch repeat-containing protein n=1 Tax=Oceanihabitans sediminis TaxID=1812012 RepID=UPI00299CDFF2|nr:T9SS type A sorting domain-containing protein [Oceanihabitans sediminis]MDX1278427.1 T9SS type A sorting domain-containing protein [Oceanihabitans sediminis]